MTKQDLLQRIQELTENVTESIENHTKLRMMIENATNQHNSLIGRLEEAKEIYKKMYGDVENTSSPIVYD